MAEGTRFAKLEASTVELQKAQTVLDDRLTEIGGRLTAMDELLGGHKEAMQNMEVMMRRLVQLHNNDRPPHNRTGDQEAHQAGFSFGRTMKVELPHFDGSDAEDWIFKVEEFFQIYNTPMDQRIRLASLHMKGAAYAWYKWIVQNSLVQSWDEFLKALLLRFGTELYDDPRVALKQLRQTSSVAEYQAKFEELSTKVTGLSEQWIISMFVAGLTDQLRCEVMLAQPTSYYQTVSMAKLHEQKQLTMQQSWRSFGSRQSFTSVGRSTQAVPQLQNSNMKAGSASNTGQKGVSIPSSSNAIVNYASNNGTAVNSSTTPAFKRLSAAELKSRREKGLCYYCDEKYSLNHKCKPTFSLLLGQEELAEILDNPSQEVIIEEPQDEAEQVTPEISFNALEGQYHPSTLRVLGNYGDHVLNILVDNGSTHNIIKASLAETLFLPKTPIIPFKVLTGSGTILTCLHKCEKGSDVVLGVQWLAELGAVVTNYKDLTMSFEGEGKQVVWKGEPMIKEVPMTMKELQKSTEQGIIYCLYQLQKLEVEVIEDASIPAPIVDILKRYNAVFKEPSALPPHRDIDHHINLEMGARPVSIRPYRYPHFQKAEIERTGSSNKVADALSRIEEDEGTAIGNELSELHSISYCQHSVLTDLKIHNATNTSMMELHKRLAEEFWYNSSYHSAIGMTPFQALYGVNPSPLPSYAVGSVRVGSLDELMVQREELQKQLKLNLQKAQTRMKKLADLRRKEVMFEEGELSQPERIVAQRVSNRGPHEVLEVLVEWQGVPREEATWEEWSVLLEAFSFMDLEDKVIFNEGGNDTDDGPTGLVVRPKRAKKMPAWTNDFELDV
ncbi:Transposon Ty3-G Gag-Pol polyprotein [Senna tora]|uniref:Transposon Ty3-G Gag-Pol polyprotein n=1 Tax=Senna tora TaxID=362788 RepID=A0A834TBP3_9FABA|nr:Transposon Ty3-G Gag-Pol polyprotein [Senna tora]